MTSQPKSYASKAFGQHLKALREREGYDTASEFARVLGVEPHTYRAWERGAAEPDFQTTIRICRILHATPNQLLLGLTA